MAHDMTPLVRESLALHPARGELRSEAEIIAGRIASNRHWRRRRAVLRVRAGVFGRRKMRDAGRRLGGAARPLLRTRQA